MPNTELLTKTLTHIETHPDRWDQRSWRTPRPGCGTAHCFAGWAIVLAGADFAGPVQAIMPGVDMADYDQWRDIDDVAAELLDIPNGTDADDDMAPLFHPDNTLDDLRRIVAKHIAEAAA